MKFGDATLPVPRDLHHLVLNVFCKPLLQRFCNHGDLIPADHTQTQLQFIFQPNQPSLRRWWQHAVKLSEHTTTVQRLHLFFILFIGRFSETLQGGRLHHSLTEGHHRVSYLWWKPKVEIIYSDKWVNICEQKKHLDVNLRVHLPQVVHDTVQVQLTCAKNHMFSRLLHLKRQTPNKFQC